MRITHVTKEPADEMNIRRVPLVQGNMIDLFRSLDPKTIERKAMLVATTFNKNSFLTTPRKENGRANGAFTTVSPQDRQSIATV